MYHTYSTIFCFSSINQSLKHEQEIFFDAMGILKSLSKSHTQVTQIKTLIISLLAQNSHIAGCMVCANISVALSIYICCFPVSITWAYLLTERYSRSNYWPRGTLGQYCLLTERYSRSVLLLEWSPWFFFPPLRLTLPTAKSSNSIIFKFLVLIQQ